jgi:hypothetical protein
VLGLMVHMSLAEYDYANDSDDQIYKENECHLYPITGCLWALFNRFCGGLSCWALPLLLFE